MSVAHELDMGGEYNLPAPVQLLRTDESLEWHYGHLSPAEVIGSDLDKRQIARLAQLQMIATRSYCDISNEYADWLRVYGNTIGPSDGI